MVDGKEPFGWVQLRVVAIGMDYIDKLGIILVKSWRILDLFEARTSGVEAYTEK